MVLQIIGKQQRLNYQFTQMVMKTSGKDANIKMLAIPENGLHHA